MLCFLFAQFPSSFCPIPCFLSSSSHNDNPLPTNFTLPTPYFTLLPLLFSPVLFFWNLVRGPQSLVTGGTQGVINFAYGLTLVVGSLQTHHPIDLLFIVCEVGHSLACLL